MTTVNERLRNEFQGIADASPATIVSVYFKSELRSGE